MPIRYFYDEAENILFEKGEGNVTLVEFQRYRDEISKIGMKPGVRCVADYRNAVVKFTFDDMIKTIEHNRRAISTVNDIRVAICAFSDLGFGMARSYALVNETESYRVEVFRDMDEACRSLNIEAFPEF